eukprot:COSAG02_NODE_4292_length_5541_cov_1.733370_7_plen_117_part_00
MRISNCMCSLAAVSTSDTRNQGHNVDLRFSTARLTKRRVGYCSSCTQITMACMLLGSSRAYRAICNSNVRVLNHATMRDRQRVACRVERFDRVIGRVAVRNIYPEHIVADDSIGCS